MKKIYAALIMSSCLFVAAPLWAQGNSAQAVQHSGRASAEGSQATIHGLITSGQVTSGAVAVPLGVSGAVGTVSGEMGKELMEAAATPIGTPLEITDETVSVGPPPDVALGKGAPAGEDEKSEKILSPDKALKE